MASQFGEDLFKAQALWSVVVSMKMLRENAQRRCKRWVSNQASGAKEKKLQVSLCVFIRRSFGSLAFNNFEQFKKHSFDFFWLDQKNWMFAIRFEFRELYGTHIIRQKNRQEHKPWKNKLKKGRWLSKSKLKKTELEMLVSFFFRNFKNLSAGNRVWNFNLSNWIWKVRKKNRRFKIYRLLAHLQFAGLLGW